MAGWLNYEIKLYIQMYFYAIINDVALTPPARQVLQRVLAGACTNRGQHSKKMFYDTGIMKLACAAF